MKEINKRDLSGMEVTEKFQSAMTEKNRKVGLKLDRKRQHFRPKKSHICPFKLIVKVDKYGYYILQGNGCRTHCYHIKSGLKGGNNKIDVSK